MRKRLWAAIAGAALALAAVGTSFAVPLAPMQELGKKLFFDKALSTPSGVACAACHGPAVGFTGPLAEFNAAGAVYPGAVHTRFGNRKPPAAAYAGQSPVLHYDADDETWVGGMFWDGRATGWTLGDPLAEQAEGPFLNPLEQNNPNARSVILAVVRSDYATLFTQVWGPGSLDPIKDVAGTYERIARSIAAYERSSEVNPFSSKYDAYLAGEVTLTEQERAGLQLFEGRAMCSNCHLSEPGPNGEPPLFTDFTYDNLGVPKNKDNPFYHAPHNVNPLGEDWVDPGLGGFLAANGYPDEAAENWGKQKVPTLRNVDARPDPGFVKAFCHNGYFKSLEEIVHFYNTRDVATWPPPEVAENVNHEELGNLGLTANEEAEVVAFLRTLTDGYTPPGSHALASATAESGSAGRSAIDAGAGRDYAVRGPVTIQFALESAGEASLTIYDVRGRAIRALPPCFLLAGENAVVWDGTDGAGSRVPTGVYFYHLRAGAVSRVGKIAQIK